MNHLIFFHGSFKDLNLRYVILCSLACNFYSFVFISCHYLLTAITLLQVDDVSYMQVFDSLGAMQVSLT